VGQKTLWLMSPRWLRSGDDGNWKLMLLTIPLSKTLSLGSVTKKVYFFYPSCEDANEPSDSIKITLPDYINICHFFSGALLH
jgi:hypothetical protein